MKNFNMPKKEFEHPKTLNEYGTKPTDKGETNKNSQDETAEIVSTMTLTGIL